MAGNKLDPQFVVIRESLSPTYGVAVKYEVLRVFPARADARAYAAAKSSRARPGTKYRVQRVLPGPTARKP